MNILRHLHEIKSGRTSSISHEIIGFDSKGRILNYAEMMTAEEICDHASKIVTFIDLAGHKKYLRTTLLGLTGKYIVLWLIFVSLVINFLYDRVKIKFVNLKNLEQRKHDCLYQVFWRIIT